MVRRIHRLPLVFFLVGTALALLMGGCYSGHEEKVETEGYQVYYLVNGTTTLSTETFIPQGEEAEELILELYAKMQETDNVLLASVIPANVYITNTSLSKEGLASITFSENYSDMDSASEILFRQAVVKTMVQIPGIEYLSFYVADHALLSASGATYGPMNAASFVSDVEDAMEDLTRVEVTLYYSDLTGTALVGETTQLAYSQSIPIEQVIVEQLIKGPTTDSCKDSLPENVDVISVFTRDGICYVNLDNDFLNSVADCTAEVTLYSIVNSLSELSTIKNVQILVGGSGDYTFREIYSLNDTYTRDLNLVAGSTQAETETAEP